LSYVPQPEKPLDLKQLLHVYENIMELSTLITIFYMKHPQQNFFQYSDN